METEVALEASALSLQTGDQRSWGIFCVEGCVCVCVYVRMLIC